jgi:cyclase
MQNGGRVDMGIDAVEWAIKANELGAGEILQLLFSISKS